MHFHMLHFTLTVSYFGNGYLIYFHLFHFRNALNVVKDDLIAKVDELTRYVHQLLLLISLSVFFSVCVIYDTGFWKTGQKCKMVIMVLCVCIYVVLVKQICWPFVTALLNSMDRNEGSPMNKVEEINILHEMYYVWS